MDIELLRELGQRPIALGYGSGAVVSAWSLLIRRQQRARLQAESPLIVSCQPPRAVAA